VSSELRWCASTCISIVETALEYATNYSIADQRHAALVPFVRNGVQLISTDARRGLLGRYISAKASRREPEMPRPPPEEKDCIIHQSYECHDWLYSCPHQKLRKSIYSAQCEAKPLQVDISHFVRYGGVPRCLMGCLTMVYRLAPPFPRPIAR